MSLLAEKPHPWIEAFVAAPADDRLRVLDTLLSDVADVPPYGRALPHQAAVTLFRPAGGEAVRALDAALAAWLAERRGWTAEQRRTYGLERFIADVDQGLVLLGFLDLPDTAAWLRAWFFDLMRWAAALSRDPAWRLDRSVALARAQVQAGDDTSMRHYWPRLAENAAVPDKRPLLDAALLGLARLPEREPGTIPPDVVAALARWARRLPADSAGQTAFRKRWRGVKARYPAAGPTWRDLWSGALGRDREADPPPPYVEWLNGLEPGLQRGRGRAVSYEFPSLDELKTVQAAIRLQVDVEVRRRIDGLIERHERYARGTGDTYYLVRSVSSLARQLMDRSPADALALARRALAWEPDDAHSWSIRGRALARLGHLGLAEMVFWEAARRLPSNEAIRVDLAALRAGQGEEAEAERLLRDVRAANPENAPSAVELARLLARRGEAAEAERLLRDVRAANPENAPSAVELALLLARSGRIEAALQSLEPFVAEHRREPVALYTLAVLRIAAGMDARAQADAYRDRFGRDRWHRTIERQIAAGEDGARKEREHLARPPETPAPTVPADAAAAGAAAEEESAAPAFTRIASAVRAELLLRLDAEGARREGRGALDRLLSDDDDLLAHTAYILHDAEHRRALAGRLDDYPHALALRLAVAGAANGSVDWGVLRRAHPEQIALIDLAYLVRADANDSASRGRLADFAAAESAAAATPAAALVRACLAGADLTGAAIDGDLRDRLSSIVAAGTLSAVEVDGSVVPVVAVA